MEWIFVYLVLVVVFFLLDILWLGGVAGTYYRRVLGDLLRPRFRMGPAAIFYLLYLVGVIVFAVVPAHDAEALVEAAWRGAFLGLIAYGTYDLTNFATVRDWPLEISVVDMAWGTVLTAVTSTVGYLAAGWFM